MDETNIRQAREEDRKDILRIMEFWNMHHVPSEEMPDLDISCFFVAEQEGRIVGASGYKMISPTEGKTTLLGVDPTINGRGIGRKLQLVRMKAMYDQGAETLITNADRPRTISWYKELFGYVEIGAIPKVHSFGDDSVSEWTTLKTNLKTYFDG
jgi:3-oxoadipate:acetyl-CoA acetyltransferase